MHCLSQTRKPHSLSIKSPSCQTPVLKLRARLELTLAGYSYSYTRGFYSRHCITGAPIFFQWEETRLLCWLYCETTPVPPLSAYSDLLVTLQASSGSAGILLTVKTPSACQVPYLYNILAFFADSAMILVLLHV